jgi:hypothetical protein
MTSRAEPSPPVWGRGLPLVVASAVLSMCLSPIIMAPLALRNERVFSRTSGWHFSTIPIPDGCYQWN